MSISDKKIGIISQTRMTSSRLPGKVLKEVNGKPMLQYHVERLKLTGLPIIIATTTNDNDNIIVDFAKKQDIALYRGDENNVLSRYYGAAKENKLDIIIRVTSDCPLIDPMLIKEGVKLYLSNFTPQLYMSTGLQRSFPRGLGFEIFSFGLLENAYQNASLISDLEHVTPYIHQNRSGKVKFLAFTQPIDKSSYRITLDEEDDFQLLKKLIEDFSADTLNSQQITTVLDHHPELVKINSHVEQKKI